MDAYGLISVAAGVQKAHFTLLRPAQGTIRLGHHKQLASHLCSLFGLQGPFVIPGAAPLFWMPIEIKTVASLSVLINDMMVAITRRIFVGQKDAGGQKLRVCLERSLG